MVVELNIIPDPEERLRRARANLKQQVRETAATPYRAAAWPPEPFSDAYVQAIEDLIDAKLRMPYPSETRRG